VAGVGVVLEADHVCAEHPSDDFFAFFAG
jgi:hypothetical protein